MTQIAKLPAISPGMTPSPLSNISSLNEQVTSVVMTPDTKKLFYLVTTDIGSAVYLLENGTSRQIDSSPFREWVLSYGNDTLYATPKASSYAFGVMTTVPGFVPQTKELAALSVLPGAGGHLSSVWIPGSIESRFERRGSFSTLPFKTLMSKCSFISSVGVLCAVPRSLSFDYIFPDDWYKGLVSPNDDLFVYNVETKEDASYFSFDEAYGVFDIVHITPHENYFSFINKKDGALWLLQRNIIEVGL
jgi:hypothetical protein